MTDYISQEAARPDALCVGIGCQECPFSKENLNGCRAEDFIMAVPAADVAPVVRAEWRPVTNGRGGHECSRCRDYAPSFASGREYLSRFCPNCGAIMDGGEKDEHTD